MITCLIRGGIGNQLFQIFTMLAYSLENHHPCLFRYEKRDLPETQATGCIHIRKFYWDDFLLPLRDYWTTFHDPIGLNACLETFPTREFLQQEYLPLPRISPEETLHFVGYFQSYKYFEKVEKQLLDMIQYPQQLKRIQDTHASVWENQPFLVSMHFRHGDYKYVQAAHPVLPWEYYEKSLQWMMTHFCEKEDQQVLRLQVLYFCEKEDHKCIAEMVQRLSQAFPTIPFVQANNDMEDWQQLLIMSSCDSHIIANSSFSWWGAYLNRNPEKQVCYPSLWYGQALTYLDTKDMFPTNWNRIES